MTATAAPGSVSHGTMRPEDLIPCFMSKLDELKEAASLSVANGQEAATVALVSRLDDTLGDMEQRREAMGEEAYYASEEASWDLETLFDLLNDFAPEGHYFGAHEGDGCDYGFWSYEGRDDEDEEEQDDDEDE